jgi:hypothetical protein
VVVPPARVYGDVIWRPSDRLFARHHHQRKQRRRER